MSKVPFTTININFRWYIVTKDAIGLQYLTKLESGYGLSARLSDAYAVDYRNDVMVHIHLAGGEFCEPYEPEMFGDNWNRMARLLDFSNEVVHSVLHGRPVNEHRRMQAHELFCVTPQTIQIDGIRRMEI